MKESAFIQSFSKIVPDKTDAFYENVDALMQLAIMNVTSSKAYQANLAQASAAVATEKKDNLERRLVWQAGIVDRDSVITYIQGHNSEEAQTLADTLKATERHDPKRNLFSTPSMGTHQYGISTAVSAHVAEILAKEANSKTLWASFRVNLTQIKGTEDILREKAGLKPVA